MSLHVCRKFLAILAGVLALGLSVPAAAQMRGQGWDRGPIGGWGRTSDLRRSAADRSTDARFAGKIEVERFASRAAANKLGKGPVQVTANSAGIFGREMNAAYEAAIVNQLIGLGYDSLAAPAGEGQRVSVQIIREIAEPAEDKRSPMSGEAEIGVSNRGSYYGLGLNLDFSEPRPALLSTRMNVRITDDATGEVMWEGRATLYSLDGAEDYSEGAIAERLASALFAEFPAGRGDSIVD